MKERPNDLVPNRKSFLEHWLTKGDLEEFKAELLTEIKLLVKKEPEQQPRKWLKSYEVRKMLNVSSGTLQTLRVNGTLPFTKMGGALYYELKDIERILEKAKIDRTEKVK